MKLSFFSISINKISDIRFTETKSKVYNILYKHCFMFVSFFSANRETNSETEVIRSFFYIA